MKSLSILFVVLFFLPCPAMGQLLKGDHILGIDFDFNKYKGYRNSTDYSFSIDYSYMVKSKFSVGLKPHYEYKHYTDVLNVDYFNLSLTVPVRMYKSLGRNFVIAGEIFGTVRSWYVRDLDLFERKGLKGFFYTNFNYSIGCRSVVYYFVRPEIAISTSFATINYTWPIWDFYYYSSNNTSRFNADLTLSSLTFGILFILRKNKDTSSANQTAYENP